MDLPSSAVPAELSIAGRRVVSAVDRCRRTMVFAGGIFLMFEAQSQRAAATRSGM